MPDQRFFRNQKGLNQFTRDPNVLYNTKKEILQGNIGLYLNYYNSRPIEIDDQKDRLGSGSMLLMLAEMHRLLEKL